jgi:hypothetical protein
MASVLTSLRHYWLGFDNLDALVMISIKWLDDARADYPFIFNEKNVANYLYSKDALLNDQEKELQEQEHFEDEWHHPKFHVSSLILYSILLPTSTLNFFHWFSHVKMFSYVLPFKFNTLILKSWIFSFFQCRFHVLLLQVFEMWNHGWLLTLWNPNFQA